MPMMTGERANLLSRFTAQANDLLLIQDQIFRELHFDEADVASMLKARQIDNRDSTSYRDKLDQIQQSKEMQNVSKIDTQEKLRKLRRFANFVAFCAGRLIISRGKNQHGHCHPLRAVTFNEIIDARINFEETGRKTSLSNIVELTDAIPKFFKVAVRGQAGPLLFQCKLLDRDEGTGKEKLGSDIVIYISTNTSDPSQTDYEMKFVSTNKKKFSFKFTPEEIEAERQSQLGAHQIQSPIANADGKGAAQ